MNPEGFRPFVENWEEVALWSIRRLRAEAMLEVTGTLAADPLNKLLLLPDVAEIAQASHADHDLPPTVRLELMFPADDVTANWFADNCRLQ